MGELAALFQRFDWYSLIDVAIVALIFLGLLYLARGTQAAPLLRGVIILGVFFTILGSLATLPAVSWLFATPCPPCSLPFPSSFNPNCAAPWNAWGASCKSAGSRRATPPIPIT